MSRLPASGSALKASCHCGSVCLVVTGLPQTVTECTCSICRRLGVRWAYYSQAEVQLRVEPAVLKSYCWGDRTLEFYHCSRCGRPPHSESVEKGQDRRLAVNVRLFDPATVLGVKVRVFDAADTWEYLDKDISKG